MKGEVVEGEDEMSVLGMVKRFGGGGVLELWIVGMGIMGYMSGWMMIELLEMDVVGKLSEW